GGLNVVDTDAAGNATTLAGIVRINGGVITPTIPEPETYAMLLAGLGFLGFAARRRKQHGT
ncbi:MAG: PEP-CTERM sorting domain-containing protein, partial [Betaproteobacteria bacterium]